MTSVINFYAHAVQRDKVNITIQVEREILKLN
jgi:hypothetical protein